LIITVDNGITAIEEAKHAKDIGIDIIVTDHHHALDEIPEVFACINPQISPDVAFKEIC
jgi:single-stranded-DNA-specific exonuclease